MPLCVALFFPLAASSGKRNVMIWRPSVRLSGPSIFVILIGRAAHIQCDSLGGSTRRGQRTFPSECYENGHTCLICDPDFWTLFATDHPPCVDVCVLSASGVRCRPEPVRLQEVQSADDVHSQQRRCRDTVAAAARRVTQ